MADTKTNLMHEGRGRTKIILSAQKIGEDLLVRLFNEQEHVGAVAVAEYNPKEKRASTSVLTCFGHKEDRIAYAAAYKICRRLQKTVCAVAGIHLDIITEEEIEQITANCDILIDHYVKSVGSG